MISSWACAGSSTRSRRRAWSPPPPQEQREAIVHGFGEDPEAAAGLDALRGACLTMHYALPDLGTGINPNWPGMGYPGPQALPKPASEVERPIRPIVPEGEELTLEADVVIVGSGAGGGVIAGELSAQGKRVCVVEMGGYHDESEFPGLELWGYQNLFLNQGPFPTAEGQVSIQAGSGLGGGTVLNWTNCLRTTDRVRAEWAAAGLEGIDGAGYDAHMDAVWELPRRQRRVQRSQRPAQPAEGGLRGARPRLPRDHPQHRPRHLRPGHSPATSAGAISPARSARRRRPTSPMPPPATPTSSSTPGSSGSSSRTAARPGSRGPTRTRRAARPRSRSGRPRSSSPAARSSRPRCSCARGSAARRSAPICTCIRRASSSAPTPSRRTRGGARRRLGSRIEFEDLEDGYGFLLECAQHATGLSAAATPWRSGFDHKEQLSRWDHGAGFINLTRDRGHGRVTIDAAGRAVTEYALSDELDMRNLRRGLEEMIRIHDAAGVEEMQALNKRTPVWRRGDDLEAFIAEVKGLSMAPREIGLFSAHQMGSCRMGSDPATSVADGFGRLHDTPGVWIGDASAFPSASGTNPMFTVMSLARRTAEAIAASA